MRRGLRKSSENCSLKPPIFKQVVNMLGHMHCSKIRLVTGYE
jgi:hypothetical protein